MNLKFDIALPSVIICLSVIVVLLRDRFSDKLRMLMSGREFRSRDAVMLSAVIGVVISLVAVVPSQALALVFISAYSLLLFQFSYLLHSKWFTSILPPIVFLVLYFTLRGSIYWNPLMLDIFATLFAILVSIFLGVVFTWRSAIAFATAITAVDIFQVLFTGSMVMAFEKTMGLDLPVAIIIPVVPLVSVHEPLYPTLPYAFSGLGLGDLSLIGLLVTKSTEKYGKSFGFVSAFSVGFSFFIFETLAMNFGGGFYPATVFVVSGWAIAILGKFTMGLTRQNSKEKT